MCTLVTHIRMTGLTLEEAVGMNEGWIHVWTKCTHGHNSTFTQHSVSTHSHALRQFSTEEHSTREKTTIIDQIRNTVLDAKLEANDGLYK